MTRISFSLPAALAAIVLVSGFALPNPANAQQLLNVGGSSSSDIYINEFSIGSSSDWVELYNASSSPVSLTNWTLEDGATPPHTIPLSGTIGAKGFAVFEYGSPTLSSAGDTLTLLDASNATSSSIAYGSASGAVVGAPAVDASAYRTTDGGSSWAITSSPTEGSTNTPFTDTTTGTKYDSLADAVSGAASGDTIVIDSGTYLLTSIVDVTKPLTITGTGSVVLKADNSAWLGDSSHKHIIDITAGTGTTTLSHVTLDSNGQAYGLQFYKSAGVLDGVTVENSKGAGLTVNGSNVTATDFDTSGNSWGSVNIDPGSGVLVPSVFTLQSGTLGESNQIWSDGANVTGSATVTINASGYSMYKVASQTQGYVWSDKAITNAATITSGATTTLYADIPSAVAAANNGDTIVIGTGTYLLTSELDITKNITVEGNGSVVLKASSDFGTNNSTKHLIGLYAGATSTPLKLSNLTLDSNGDSYGVNTYNDAYAILDNVTIENSKGAGLTVNGSTVSATNLAASGNSWGSVNVDPGSGVKLPSVFTLESGTLSDGTQIWSDGKNVTASSTVSVSAPGYTKYTVDGTTNGYVWANKPVANTAAVMVSGVPTLYSSIAAAAAAATAGETITVGAGTYSGVALTGSYASNLTIAGNSTADTTIDGLTLTGATFDGLTFKNFTISGDAASGGASVAIESTGSYSNLSFSDNVFDGGSVAGRRALISNTGFDGFTLTDNTFQNYKDTTSGTTAYSVVFMEVQGNGSAWGDNYSATGNTLTNSDLPNFLEAYRWKDVNFSNNTVNATNGRLIVWSDTQFGPLESLGTLTISGNNIAISSGKGIGVYNATSTTANITGNTITGGAYCVYLDSVHGSIVSGNTFKNCTTAVTFMSDMDVSPITGSVTGNSFTGNTTAVDNETSLSLDATENWWNDATGPNSLHTNPINAGSGEPIVVGIGGGAAFSPWYADAALTTLRWPTSSSATTTTVTTGSSATTLTGVSTTTTSVSVTAKIPADTMVTGNSSWNGTITAPAATSTTVSFAGYDASTTAAVTVGSSKYDLYFSSPVELTFANQAGKRVGFYDAAGTFSEITNTCDSASSATVGSIALATSSPGAACKHDDGSDLVVWTTHFSTYVAYTATPKPPVISPNGLTFHGFVDVTIDDAQSGSVTHYTTDGTTPTCSSETYANGATIVITSDTTLKAIRCDSAGSSAVATASFSQAAGGGSSGGGGGGGGGSVSTPATPATPSVSSATPPAATPGHGGEVLGAAAYNFATDLSLGMSGADVTQLQQFLIASGFDIPALSKGNQAYGYFGGQTLAAVIAFQKANGISPAKGYVGSLTRAVLNRGTISTTPEHQTNLSAAQVDAILSVLESFHVDAATLANVKAALGR